MGDEARLSISEVAAQLGTNCRTLRYYEEVGLLEATERGAGGVRYYSAAVVARMRRILDLRNSRGFTLEELKEFLAAEEGLDATRASFYGDGDATVKLQALLQAEELLQHELKVVESKMKGLADLREEILDRLARGRKLRDGLNGQLK